MGDITAVFYNLKGYQVYRQKGMQLIISTRQLLKTAKKQPNNPSRIVKDSFHWPSSNQGLDGCLSVWSILNQAVIFDFSIVPDIMWQAIFFPRQWILGLLPKLQAISGLQYATCQGMVAIAVEDVCT